MKRHKIRVLAGLLVLFLMGTAAHAQTATTSPQTLQSMQQELQRMQDMVRELERQINLQQRAMQGQAQRGGATAGQAGNGDVLDLVGVLAGFQQQPGQRGGGGRGPAPAIAPNANSDNLNGGIGLEDGRIRRAQVSPDGTVITAYNQVLAGGGAWWTNTALLTRLGLTDDQKLKIERVYESHRQNLVSTKDALEKEEAQLSRLLGADPLDRTASVAQIYKVVQARGDMEKTNSLMTFEMREVLTLAQWTQLQAQTPLGINLYYTISTVRDPAGAVGVRGRGLGAGTSTPFGVAPAGAPTPAGTGGQRSGRGQ